MSQEVSSSGNVKSIPLNENASTTTTTTNTTTNTIHTYTYIIHTHTSINTPREEGPWALVIVFIRREQRVPTHLLETLI